MYDGKLGGYSGNEPSLDDHELPHWTTIYMEGTAPALDSTAAGTTGGTGALAVNPSVFGPVKTPTQVLSELVASLTTFLESPLTAEHQVECNAYVAKIRE